MSGLVITLKMLLLKFSKLTSYNIIYWLIHRIIIQIPDSSAVVGLPDPLFIYYFVFVFQGIRTSSNSWLISTRIIYRIVYSRRSPATASSRISSRKSSVECRTRPNLCACGSGQWRFMAGYTELSNRRGRGCMQLNRSWKRNRQCCKMPKTNWQRSEFYSICQELFHHHQFNVHVFPRSIKGIDGCFPTPQDRQPTLSDFVTISQLSIHGNVGASIWCRDALPHTSQLRL